MIRTFIDFYSFWHQFFRVLTRWLCRFSAVHKESSSTQTTYTMKYSFLNFSSSRRFLWRVVQQRSVFLSSKLWIHNKNEKWIRLQSSAITCDMWPAQSKREGEAQLKCHICIIHRTSHHAGRMYEHAAHSSRSCYRFTYAMGLRNSVTPCPTHFEFFPIKTHTFWRICFIVSIVSRSPIVYYEYDLFFIPCCSGPCALARFHGRVTFVRTASVFPHHTFTFSKSFNFSAISTSLHWKKNCGLHEMAFLLAGDLAKRALSRGGYSLLTCN